jgi:phosphatidate cytidylyltransferase
MLLSLLGVTAGFYLVATVLMIAQRRHAGAHAPRTPWRKFTSYAVLLVSILVVADLGGAVFHGVVLVAIAAAAFEIGRATGLHRAGRFGFTVAALMVALVAAFGNRMAVYPTATLLVGCTILAGATSTDPAEDIPKAVWASLGLCVLALPASHLLLLESRPDRLAAFAFLFLVVCSTDAFAELVGKRWPVRRGVLAVSPNKSIGGLVGGVGGGIAMALVLAVTTGQWTLLHAAGVGAVIAVAAVCGDLAASSLKRAHGIKDFGRALADHGGVLDRFDSLFFAALPYYWILQR